MPFAENNGVRLHWQEQGTGTPVLLIMGHRYSSAMWYPVLPALAAEHRVISFDNRGTGQSDAPRKFTVGDMADDALAVIDAAGIKRAHVFGVSMGGGVALELAIRHPDRLTSLLLGCTAILTADKPRLPAYVRRILYRLPMGLLDRIVAMRRNTGGHGYGSAAPLAGVEVDKQAIARDKFNLNGVIAQANAIAAYTNTKEAAAALRMPTLVLHGDEDAAVPFAWGVEIAETIPGSRFVEFKGAGHNFLVAAPEKSKEAVLGFIRDVDVSSGR